MSCRGIMSEGTEKNSKLSETDILQLGYLACNGSKSAAMYLKRHYSEGESKDEDGWFKYGCYAALAGDLESYREIRSRYAWIGGFHPEDVTLAGIFEETDGRRYHGYIAVQGNREYYIGSGETPPFVPIEVREEDLIDGKYPYMSGEDPDRYESWPCTGDRKEWIAGEPFSGDYHDPEDERFYLDVFRYFGIGCDRDEDSAMRDLLDMARNGSWVAKDMIAYAMGYERDTFRVRMTDITPKKPSDDPMAGFYEVADRHMLQECPEWWLLVMLAQIDEYGNAYDPSRTNPEGGYEDEVLYTRRYNWDEPGPPMFIFKPSGYAMGWYKYAWREAEQSENLTMGEIRRILRLCIEHIAYGREIPEGTTKELVAMPMYLYDSPEDIAEELRDMARRAPCNLFTLGAAYHVQTFDYRHAEQAEEMASEILAGIVDVYRV